MSVSVLSSRCVDLVAKWFQDLLHSVDFVEFAEGELDFVHWDGRDGRAPVVFLDETSAKIAERVLLVEGNGLFVLRLLRIGKREDERARGEMTDVAFGVIVLAVDVSVEHGNVLIRREDIHDYVAIGG